MEDFDLQYLKRMEQIQKRYTEILPDVGRVKAIEIISLEFGSDVISKMIIQKIYEDGGVLNES